MKEKTMYLKMKKEFPNVHLQRIESNISVGIPDVAYAVNSTKVGWIELKQVKNFSKKGIVKVPFRPGQLAWIKDYRKYSQRVFLFMHIKNILFVFKGEDILASYSVHNISKYSCYYTSWNNVHWVEILSLL